MKRIVLAVACLIGAALCAMPPSYVIMVQQDTVRPHHHASFAPSRELGRELDKYGFVGGMLPISAKLSLADLKEYNVVIVGVDQSDTKLSLPPEVAVRFGKMLAEYVQGGGGVWFTRNGGYQFGKDIDALNRMLEPFGAKMLNEQIVDRTKTFYAPSCRVYWTGDIDECHPVTAGVRGLFYPEPHSTYPRYTDFTSPIECSPEWTVLVRGSGTAWSFEREKAGELKPEKAGHFSSAPPFLAVREYGKGRVVLFGSTAPLYWEDTHHPFWCDGRLMAGEFGGKPGDGLTLTVNTLRWLAESSKGVYGAEHQPWTPPKDSSEVGFVPIDWDKVRFPARAFEREYQGLIGPQTSLSGGQGSPEEFIAEAQKAGYDFIAFGEELANLTPEKYERLKKVCASACQRAFRAYPGFRYYDENGCRWMVFGDRTTYPPAEWLSKKYPGRILSNNGLSRGWSWPPVILLDNHANPQRAWFQGNYKFIATAIYDSGNRLVDDSGEDYFHLNNDRFKLNPVAVRLLDHPSQVAQARCGGFQNRVRWPDADVIRAYTGRYCDYRGRYVWFRPVYVSEGPSIEDLSIVNFGTTDLAVPGNDRCRLHFRASSPDGLGEILLRDGDRAVPLRRFLCGGKQDFEITFDLFHSRNREIIPMVTDQAGRRAIGFDGWTNVQENGYERCTDNQNTFHGGKWFGSPKGRHNMRALEDYMVSRNFIYHGTPIFPGLGEEGRSPRIEYRKVLSSRYLLIIDCLMDSHFVGKTSMNHDSNGEVLEIVPNQHYRGKVRYNLFTPRQNDTFFCWIEGNLEVLAPFTDRPKVVTLYDRKDSRFFTVGTADGQEQTWQVADAPKKLAGPVEKYGFAALHPHSFLGPVGFIPLLDNLSYDFSFRTSRRYPVLAGMVGLQPTVYKAGDTIHYHYVAATGAFQSEPGTAFITSARQLGIGCRPGYTVEVRNGTAKTRDGILQATAEQGVFRAMVSRCNLPLDLPVRLSGLNPNWDAGIVYCGRNTLQIPCYERDEFLQRSITFKPRTAIDELQHIPVQDDGCGYLQIDLAENREVFIGNFFQCDCPKLFLTCVDTRPGKRCFEVHNPTDAGVTATVRNAVGFSLLGDFTKKVTVAAGSSIVVDLP